MFLHIIHTNTVVEYHAVYSLIPLLRNESFSAVFPPLKVSISMLYILSNEEKKALVRRAPIEIKNIRKFFVISFRYTYKSVKEVTHVGRNRLITYGWRCVYLAGILTSILSLINLFAIYFT